MNQMRGLGKLVLVQAKLYLRDPLSVFFSLLLAPLLLVMMGFIFGNEPQPLLGGKRQLDISVPAYSAIVIGIVGMTALPIGTASRRDVGALRRFRATPLRPLTYIIGDAAVYLAMTLLGVLLLILLGLVAYHVRWAGGLLPLLVGIVVSAAAFLTLGYVVASLVPTMRATTIICNVLLYPMVYLSGATLPQEMMSESVRRVSQFIPLTYVVTLMRGLWVGESLGQHLTEIAVLCGIVVLGTIVAALTFRWE